MRTSETIGTLIKAMAQAQAEMKNAPLNKTNPHFRSRYADLSAVRDATVPALSKNGLTIIQAPGFSDQGLVLYTRLAHAEGEWIEAEYPLIIGNPQQMGSALTYARRYCWASICSIAADEDDDAQAASAEAPSEPAKRSSAKRSSTGTPSGHAERADSGHSVDAAGGPSRADEARRRFIAALGNATDIKSAAALDSKLAKAKEVLGPHYTECAAALQARVAKLVRNRGKRPVEIAGETYEPPPAEDAPTFGDEVAELEPEEWKQSEGRDEDERQPALLE